jgi:hypothetical protein
VQVDFEGGEITSDGGSLLLRQVDRRTDLTRQVSRQLDDPRVQGRCWHRQLSLLRQRVYGVALGYEDLNDHDPLRHDPGFQTAVESDRALASASTLCRFENRAERQTAVQINEVMVEQFIASHRRPPKRVVLDFDATDDSVHGQQQGRFFHGYYDHYCFLPLYVFCGSQLLVAYLRPSNIDPARHAWAVLSLLVKRLRQAWPGVKIVFRGDSGFCRWRLLRWSDRHGVGYIVGLAKNKRINELAAALLVEAEQRFNVTGEKQRLFAETRYGARTWDCKRRVIIKAEHSSMGSNPRYVVTNLPGDPQKLYDRDYVARGDMENRIKEQQLDLFSDRTSTGTMRANQLRLWFSSIAYVLLSTMRRVALNGTRMAKATCGTIRLKLLKIGAQITVSVRRFLVRLASACPYQDVFIQAWRNLEQIPMRC